MSTTSQEGNHPLQAALTASAASFDVRDRVVVVTGATGALGRVMALGLAAAGARVGILARNAAACAALADEITRHGGMALALPADVQDRAALDAAERTLQATFGPADGLVTAAGGNAPEATTTPEHLFFDLDADALRAVFESNWLGSVLCCQVFGRSMAARGTGSIVTIASMSALRPLTRIPAYSAAKAALVNTTQWLATDLAQHYGPGIRVNALAPGFFLTTQNRYLLLGEDDQPTPRAQAILAHTPMGRLGAPKDLLGPLLWLLSPASAFVTGIVVPVDGGFSAFAGV